MKRITIVLGLIGLMVFASCKKEKELDMTVMNKTLLDGAVFTEINVTDAWNVTLVQDDQNTGVNLEYSAFLEEYLDVRQTDNALGIGFTTKLDIPSNTVMNAVVHVKSIEKITLDDASICRGDTFTGNICIILDGASQLVNFNVSGGFHEMQLSQASDFKGNLTADSLNIVMNDGSRMVTYGGQVQRLRMRFSDNCKLNMIHTPTDEAFVALEKGSEATLHVDTLLKGSLREASTVYLQGTPDIDIDCDDSSSIQPFNK